MKCDELNTSWVYYSDEGNISYYRKDMVDEAIAELKAENAQLKKDADTAIATLQGAIDEKTERIVELQKQVDMIHEKDMQAPIEEMEQMFNRQYSQCNELKEHKDYADIMSEWFMGRRFYVASDVDAVISEKDKEIARQNTEIKEAVKTMKSLEAEIIELKQKLHNAEMRADLAEAANTEYRIDLKNIKDNIAKHARNQYYKHNRQTLRALWLARAEWARSSALSYHLIEIHPNKDVSATYKRKANKWEKVKDKCLKKSEEYK